jgi:hypothetical protein
VDGCDLIAKHRMMVINAIFMRFARKGKDFICISMDETL